MPIHGVRDDSLLHSALSQPLAIFGSIYLHHDIYSMAAAYAYHLCQNHPFVDGNKRTALVCALVFLEINGITIIDEDTTPYVTIICVTMPYVTIPYVTMSCVTMPYNPSLDRDFFGKVTGFTEHIQYFHDKGEK